MTFVFKDVSDERLRKTSELLMGIKLIKLLGWEKYFAKMVTAIREKELKILRSDAIYVALNSKCQNTLNEKIN